MEPLLLFVLYSLVLIAVSLVAAYLPYAGKLEDKSAHYMVALSTGIFMGLMTFMLLPEGIEECEEGGIDTHYAMFALLAGFVLIMIIDTIMKNKHVATCGCELHKEEHGHRVNSMSSFFGLAIHAACDGLALAAMFLAGEEVGLMATIGLCIHKFAELFSLSSTMLLSDLGKKRSLIRLGIFSLITPVAGLLFFLLFSDMEVEGALGIPLTFAAGTLLFVTTCNMIPEAFHRDKGYKTLALILLGIAIMLVVALAFPHSH